MLDLCDINQANRAFLFIFVKKDALKVNWCFWQSTRVFFWSN